MFSNLSKGNVLYGLDLSGDKMTYFNATIEEAKPAFPINVGQIPGSVVDITAINKTFILADSKDALVNYVNAKLQASRNIVNSYDEHKKLVEQYEDVLSQINPNPNGAELKELKQQFSTMQSQFSELMSILKSKQNT